MWCVLAVQDWPVTRRLAPCEHRSLASDIGKSLSRRVIRGPEPEFCVGVVENLLCPCRSQNAQQVRNALECQNRHDALATRLRQQIDKSRKDEPSNLIYDQPHRSLRLFVGVRAPDEVQ